MRRRDVEQAFGAHLLGAVAAVARGEGVGGSRALDRCADVIGAGEGGERRERAHVLARRGPGGETAAGGAKAGSGDGCHAPASRPARLPHVSQARTHSEEAPPRRVPELLLVEERMRNSWRRGTMNARIGY